MTHEEMFAGSSIELGKQYTFDYPVEFTSLDEYSVHRGETVTVERATNEDEAAVIWDEDETGKPEIVDRMFVVKASDGWIGHAWESELCHV